MDVANEILDAIEIIVDKKIRENTAQIYPGVCKSVSGNTCVVSINGKDNTVRFYGSTPSVDSIYRVFVPNGNMSMAFVITGGGSGGGSSPSGVTSYKELTDLPSINGVILQEGATSKSLSLYGSGNEPNYPVTKVNDKTGEVILTASDVGAAPAGFGLGEENGKYAVDANTAKRNGWYIGGGENAVNFPSYGHKYGELFVLTRNSTIEQFAIYQGTICVRYSTDNGTTWSTWEYVNPPMALGVEYRTIERHLGDPVYVKLVDCGLVVDGKIIDLGLSNPAIITDAVVILQNGPGPAFYTSTGLGNYGFSYFIDYYYGTPRTCSITFHVGASLNNNPSHGYVTIKYVKRK